MSDRYRRSSTQAAWGHAPAGRCSGSTTFSMRSSSRRTAARSSPSTSAGPDRRAADPQAARRPAVAHAADIDFFKRQKKIVLRNCGAIDPQRIEDYIARDGYQALAKVSTAERPRGGDRDDADLRAARPRRGRFPHLAEVEVHPPGAGDAEIRRLQRRRRRPRRVHGPQRAGGRSAQRHRGHGHRRRTRSGPRGATSTSAPSIRWRSSG